MDVATLSERFRSLAESGDWLAAAAALDGSREPGDIWLRTLARNLDALRLHRGALYAELLSADAPIVFDHDCRMNEARIAEAFAEAEPFRSTAQPIAVAGIGDGTLLRALAKHPLELPLGRQQQVSVLEPDFGRLLGALGAADLTGPDGPIEQPRFAWHVGTAWAESLCTALVDDRTMVPPQHRVTAGEPRPEIDGGIEEAHRRVREACDADAAEVDAHYARLDDVDLLAAFSPALRLTPRVLLITSRFTTVLQYSTRDSADAFRQLGWDARVVAETTPWHAMSVHAIRAAIADFKPDLVFQIDHLRSELGGVVPATLPFICWIQDHLPNLTNAAAGAAVGERDFVLTGGAYIYAGRHGYPRRQCVDMPKVSRPPRLPTSWTTGREELLYVSHWSQTPDAAAAETCALARESGGPAAESLMRACTVELMRRYEEGDALRSSFELRGMVRGVLAGSGGSLDAAAQRSFVDLLFFRLNNTLYRQQALAWAGRVADELGLKFGIYGNGWIDHPTLGRFARGVAAYGPELEALTRESKILLQLEPYACYTHPRMLDAVLAGGFALIREHPMNALPIHLRAFLDAHVPAEANTVDEARAFLDADGSRAFDALLADAGMIADVGDPVDVVRGWQRAGVLGDGDAALPHLDAIGFDTFEGLRGRVLQYLNDDDARRRISSAQRESVLGRLTYVGALGRALTTIHERLRETIGASPPVRHAEAA